MIMNKKQYKEKYKYFVLMFPKLTEKEAIRQYTYFMMDAKESYLKNNPEFKPIKISKLQRKMLRKR